MENPNNKESENKPEPSPQTHISLKVAAQDGTEVFFRLNSNTPMKKLINAYCTRQSINPDAIRFLFDGERILAEKTPKELGLEDGDLIDAVLMQTGGGFRA